MAISILVSIADRWIGRNARASPEALSAVAGLQPAVVVTGASRGIGLALARHVAAEGRSVILIARKEAALVASAEQVRSGAGTGSGVETLALDIATSGAPQAIEAFARARGFYVDVLVNNAGIGMAGEFAEGDARRLDEMIQLNVAALTRLTRHMLPDMLARGRGGVLNISSLGGYAPGPYQAAYYASKAYVTSLTEALGLEVAGRGVRIAVVAPGPVETEFHRDMGAQRALYRWIVPSLGPERVARIAWRGFRLGRCVIVPGILSNLLALALWVLPNAILVPIIALLLAPGSPAHKGRPPV